MSKLLVFFACIAVACAPAFADTSAPLAPSAVIGAASTYDKQDVTVTGTVKNITTRNTPRGTMTRYQICDSQCVNVVQFAGDAPTEGQSQTVSGRFRASVTRRRGGGTETNVIMLMPPGGWRGGH